MFKYNSVVKVDELERVEGDYKVSADDVSWVDEKVEMLEQSDVLSDDVYSNGFVDGVNAMLNMIDGSKSSTAVFDDIRERLELAGQVLYQEYMNDMTDIEWSDVMRGLA